MLQLKLFGQFEINGISAPAELSNVKLRGLLACLALSVPGGETRDRLTTLLWGSRFQKQADQSFRQALARLRKVVGSETILVSEQFVKLSPLHIASDVSRFESLVRAGSKEALREAVALADGELLLGVDIREPGWEEWLSKERRRLTNLIVDASLALGEIELRNGDAAAALRHGEAITRRDVFREDAHRLIMRSLAKLGRRTEALTHYKELADLLRKELNATVEPATLKCHEQIREGSREFFAHAPKGGSDDNLPAQPSIAVLPFTNLGSDPEHEFFAEGLTVDLITDLCRAADLFVIAANSTFAYKGKSIDVRTIARELGVHHILEGSVRRAGERIRINVQLIDAKLGGTLWADRFDLHLSALFAVQDELVAKIIEALVGRLTTPRTSERRRVSNWEAYDLCARACQLLHQSPQASAEARVHLERAIALDPTNAEAYRWLAHSLYVPWWLEGRSNEPNRSLALEAARKAIDLDPLDAGAHWTLGSILSYEPDTAPAEAEFATALKLDPNNADAWGMLSELMVLKGQSADALANVEKAFRLNPRPPGWYYWLLGQALYLNREYERAIVALRHEATYRSDSRRTLAASLAQAGRFEEACREAKLFMSLNPGFRVSHWIEFTRFADKAAGQHFVDGYRKAGLPE